MRVGLLKHAGISVLGDATGNGSIFIQTGKYGVKLFLITAKWKGHPLCIIPTEKYITRALINQIKPWVPGNFMTHRGYWRLQKSTTAQGLKKPPLLNKTKNESREIAI